MDVTRDWLCVPGMFLRPRQTIAAIVEDERYGPVMALAAVGGVFDALVRAADTKPDLAPAVACVLAVIVGSLGGVVMLYLSGWLVGVCGRWFGGRASGDQLRAALAWGRVPSIAAGLVFLAKQIGFGWGGEAAVLEEGTQLGALWTLLGLNALMLAFALWSLVSTVVAVSEVQRISAARTVGSFLLAGLLFAAFVFALVIVVGGFRR